MLKLINCAYLFFQLNRVKMVRKEKDALEGERNKALEFLSLENKMFKEKNKICQYYMWVKLTLLGMEVALLQDQ